MYLPIIIFLFIQKTYEIMNQILMRIKKNCVPTHVHSAHIATAAHHHICCPSMLMSQCLHICSFFLLFLTELLGIVYCEAVHLSILFPYFFTFYPGSISNSRATIQWGILFVFTFSLHSERRIHRTSDTSDFWRDICSGSISFHM